MLTTGIRGSRIDDNSLAITTYSQVVAMIEQNSVTSLLLRLNKKINNREERNTQTMKITCHRERLLTAFQTAATVAAARTSKAILQNVKMDASSSRVTLTATDLEVGIRVELEEQEVEVPGNALLSVSQFGSILRESSDERIHIESDGQGIRIRGDRSRFRLPSQNPAEYQIFPNRVTRIIIRSPAVSYVN